MTDIKQQPGFCYEIFKNQAFWSYKNTIAYNPCSFYNGYIDTNSSPEEVWFGRAHNALIEKIKQGDLLPGCEQCYKTEQAGIKSRRQGSRQLFEEFLNEPDIGYTESPTTIDYSVGNLCNLKCTICGPSNSSKWINDWKELYPDKDISRYLYRKNHYVEIMNLDYLKNIKRVHFHGGGDPFLSDAHVNLLKKIKLVKGLSDVSINYNINATNLVSDEILNLWSECRLVELYFSIDDIDERFNYQRTGANWKQVTKNLQWFKTNMPSNHMFYINCTWGYLNLFYLDELVNWHKNNFNENRLGDPIELIFQKCYGDYQIDFLNKNTLDILSDKFLFSNVLSNLLRLIEVSDKPHTNFWEKISKIDKIRKTSFKKTFSEWSNLL